MNMNDNVKKLMRFFLGLFLILYALNKFFHIVPTGYGDMPEDARDFLDGVAIYLPYLYIFEILIGLLLIINIWIPLLLIVIFPLSFSFVFFSLSNGDFSEIWPALIVAILNIALLYGYRDKYKSLFSS